ncbi:hypothetical protein UFOVP634_8 [uncultured Caudovirales phage]|uniref:DUF6291 domain-containing protein n=1 Tax=uncultured Caudovirales phage TaxID=2100421 RepID=A0A6J5N831_9CAUD|nr:hypothetical protein UFOVP634_8 [uncultured Caudovirales phage]
MAENKKSFVLYTDSQGLINQLPDDIAGRLFKHIYAYVNDENPITDELLLNIAFEPIKMQLKRDLIKWVDIKETKSNSGNLGNLKRYNIDLYEKVLSNNITLKEAIELAKTRKNSHSDILPSQDIAKLAVNDNVNVNVNVINKIEARSQTFKDSLLQYKDKYQVNMLKEFYNYWTEPNQSKSKMRFELEKTWSLDRRLETWAKRENLFNVKPQIKQDRL